MTLSQKHRSSIYRNLVPILGEEEAEALMHEFPATERDELVTRGMLQAETAMLRQEIAEFRAEVAERLQRQTTWTASAMFAGLAVAAAIGALAG